MINQLMKNKNITMYRLAKSSQVPYTTVSDICTGRVDVKKCSVETLYKLAKQLDITVDELLAPYMEERCSFELFKSNVCHRLKALSDIDFLITVLETDEIRTYYNRKWYAESFYLLAMVDYLSRIHQVPQCNQYDDIRKLKLKYPLFPSSILIAAAVSNDSDKVKSEAQKNAIPEFYRFNIVESGIRDVV